MGWATKDEELSSRVEEQRKDKSFPSEWRNNEEIVIRRRRLLTFPFSNFPFVSFPLLFFFYLLLQPKLRTSEQEMRKRARLMEQRSLGWLKMATSVCLSF